MIDVSVSIAGILMCCDESLCDVNLGRGYTIEKCDFEDLPFKESITDGKGYLDTDYFGSRIFKQGKMYFVCIKKEEIIQIEGPRISASGCVLTDKDFMCEEELAQFKNEEIKYLNERINLLRLFKVGNIGFRDIFFRYSFTVMGLIKNTLNSCSHNQTRNTISNKIFTLNKSEVILCNEWINDYCNEPYLILKECIDEFSWGLEQIDIPTGFEQYTTALEMSLLPSNQPGKKQMLANRISAILGNTSSEVTQIYNRVLLFYRFRSESLHEGNGSNITESELCELENMTREVLKKCLIRCKSEYTLKPNITWGEIKDLIMNELIVKVQYWKGAGALPIKEK